MTDHSLTRRRLVGAGAVAGAGALLGTPAGAEARKKRAHHKPARRRRRVDAVVVGAGLAGLTAAHQLLKAGRSVLVLEAGSRVGGRVLNKSLGDGKVTERGGTFAGPTQDHILALADEMGVGKFETFSEGDNVYVADGSRTTYSDSGPLGTAPPDPLIVAEVAATVARLDQMATEVPVNSPWTAGSAADWDGQTFESWIRQNSVTPRFRQIVSTATRPIFGAEPRELSL